MPIASCPDTGYHRKEPGSVLFALSLQVFVYVDSYPLELNRPSSLSLSSQERCFMLSSIFMALCWTLCCVSMSLLCWGTHNWTSTPGVASLVLNRITSLDLMVRLCPVSPRYHQPPLWQGHTADAPSSRSSPGHQVLFCRAAFQLGGSHHVLVPGGCFSPGTGLGTSLCRTASSSCEPISPSC